MKSRLDRCYGCGHDRERHCFGARRATCAACSHTYGHASMQHRICHEFVEVPQKARLTEALIQRMRNDAITSKGPATDTLEFRAGVEVMCNLLRAEIEA